MAAGKLQRCRFFPVWCILLFIAPSTGTSPFSFFSSDCVDYSYGESWRLEEIVSLAAMSRLTCASQCMQTMECRGFSLDGAVCRLLRVVAAVGGLTGCDSRANVAGTTFLASVTHNELSERLGECPYFTEWQARGGDSEGERWGDRCVCPDRKRGVFCHLGKESFITETSLVPAVEKASFVLCLLHRSVVIAHRNTMTTKLLTP
ncbi:hypothetical protein LSAT2_028156 [Lamellibrachia satsuma]|nr:hypothetical protein LSAT2_028156 [Lamellibrachia satsuma]